MSEDLKPKSGLYVTATPIGNLGDVTSRAALILRGVDAVICEDTRVSHKLMSALGIKKPLIPCHEHNEEKAIPALIKRLQGGEALALITDAGTPLISDPGYRLVRACQDAGVMVTPVPGASSVAAALSAGGLATDAFYFAGFLPAKEGKREAALAALNDIPATLIFFESPARVLKTVEAMVKVFGPEREAVMARELTKLHEEILRLPLSDLAANLKARAVIKGEIVLLVERGAGADAAENYDAVLLALLETRSVGDAATMLAKLLGRPRKEIYARALGLKK